MTTITYKDGVICCDGAVINGWEYNILSTTKIAFRKTKYRTLFFGAAGDFDLLQMAKEHFHKTLWCNKIDTFIPFSYDIYKELAIVLVDPNEQCTINPFTMNPEGILRYGFAILGSGGPLAAGAMLHGASALEAVAVSCIADTGSAYPIYSYDSTGKFREYAKPSDRHRLDEV